MPAKINPKTEVNRLIRHFAPVAVTYLVLQGTIPAELAGPVTEIVIIVASAAVAYAVSLIRDVKRAVK